MYDTSVRMNDAYSIIYDIFLQSVIYDRLVIRHLSVNI
jgi:hypothetical protein